MTGALFYELTQVRLCMGVRLKLHSFFKDTHTFFLVQHATVWACVEKPPAWSLSTRAYKEDSFCQKLFFETLKRRKFRRQTIFFRSLSRTPMEISQMQCVRFRNSRKKKWCGRYRTFRTCFAGPDSSIIHSYNVSVMNLCNVGVQFAENI